MFTIIIACRNISNVTFRESRRLDYVDEVILTEGSNPSLQRNKATLEAKSDWILFIDDDCDLYSNTLEVYRDFIALNEVDILGGPALIRNEGHLSRFFSYIFKSWFAFHSSRSRYTSLGQPRRSSERELILCNLVINRNFFLKNKGFKDGLHPNEENEFLARVEKGNIWYHPDAMVSRSLSESYLKIIKKIFIYAYTRGLHLFKNFSFGNLIFLTPVAFILTFILFFVFPVSLLPIILFYVCVNIAFSIQIGVTTQSLAYFLLSLVTFFLVHLSYGAGLLLGSAKYILRGRKC